MDDITSIFGSHRKNTIFFLVSFESIASALLFGSVKFECYIRPWTWTLIIIYRIGNPSFRLLFELLQMIDRQSVSRQLYWYMTCVANSLLSTVIKHKLILYHLWILIRNLSLANTVACLCVYFLSLTRPTRQIIETKWESRRKN